jgi:hypothetical protein
MRFDRLRSGHYCATTGETPHRWYYDITRVTRRVWRVAQIRLQRGCDIIVIDTRADSSGARKRLGEGCSRSVTT